MIDITEHHKWIVPGLIVNFKKLTRNKFFLASFNSIVEQKSGVDSNVIIGAYNESGFAVEWVDTVYTVSVLLISILN